MLVIAGQGEVVLGLLVVLVLTRAYRMQLRIRCHTQLVRVVVCRQWFDRQSFRLLLLVLAMRTRLSRVHLSLGIETTTDVRLVGRQVNQTGSKWTLALKSFRRRNDCRLLWLWLVVMVMVGVVVFCGLHDALTGSRLLLLLV